MSRSNGTVVSWKGGFGFVADARSKEQLFVHFSALKMEGDAFRALSEGQEVEYDVVVEQDGRSRADNVTAVGGAPLPPAPRVPNGGRGGGHRGEDGGRGRGGRGRGSGGFGGGRGGFQPREGRAGDSYQGGRGGFN